MAPWLVTVGVSPWSSPTGASQRRTRWTEGSSTSTRSGTTSRSRRTWCKATPRRCCTTPRPSSRTGSTRRTPSSSTRRGSCYADGTRCRCSSTSHVWRSAFLAAWCIGRPYGRGHLTVVAAAIVLECHTLVVREPGAAKNDLVAAALLLAAVAILINAWSNHRRAGRLLPGGGTVGGPAPEDALATGRGGGPCGDGRRPGGPCLAPRRCGPCHRPRRRHQVHRRSHGSRPDPRGNHPGPQRPPPGRRLTWWFVPALLGGAYWYLRNLIVAGNPCRRRPASARSRCRTPSACRKAGPTSTSSTTPPTPASGATTSSPACTRPSARSGRWCSLPRSSAPSWPCSAAATRPCAGPAPSPSSAWSPTSSPRSAPPAPTAPRSASASTSAT